MGDRYSLTNAQGLSLSAIPFGATIVTLSTPDRARVFDDIVLGFDDPSEYRLHSPYCGAVVGRYANRIADGRFTLDGATYQLARNDGRHALHGGGTGFDKVVWHAEPLSTGGDGVRFAYRSPDGEEGYPGNLDVTVAYTLGDDDALTVDYRATTDRATPINLSQHTYFNLGGAARGDILGHVLQLNADQYLPVDATLIPTGELRAVAGTPFDFRMPTPIGLRIGAADDQLRHAGGYDHTFAIAGADGSLRCAARVLEPTSGRTMEVWTTEPGVQFYSGNFLDGTVRGKGALPYLHRSGFCLETQHFPDSPNHPGFPSTILRPGETFVSQTVFRFGVER